MRAALVLGLALLAALAAADGLRDPFQRPARARAAAVAASAAPARPAPRRLQGVVLGARSLARIDGRLVAVGEQVAGYTLREVGPGRAVLARGGRRLVLTMDAGGGQ